MLETDQSWRSWVARAQVTDVGMEVDYYFLLPPAAVPVVAVWTDWDGVRVIEAADLDLGELAEEGECDPDWQPRRLGEIVGPNGVVSGNLRETA